MFLKFFFRFFISFVLQLNFCVVDIKFIFDVLICTWTHIGCCPSSYNGNIKIIKLTDRIMVFSHIVLFYLQLHDGREKKRNPLLVIIAVINFALRIKLSIALRSIASFCFSF